MVELEEWAQHQDAPIETKEHDEPEGVIKVINADGIKYFLGHANTLTKSVM